MKRQTVIATSLRILEHLALRGPATQADLAGINQLKRTAIFYVFDALRSSGLVREEEQATAQRGRPARLWRLTGQPGQFVSAYFNTFHNYYALYDFTGQQQELAVTAPCHTIDEAMDDLRAHIDAWPTERLCGVMVGLSGTVDHTRGEVVASRRWGLQKYPLQQALQARLPHQPLVMVENNARLAAWGERVAGVCQGLDHFLTLHVHGGRGAESSRPLGLGSGLVLDGRLFRGHHGLAGELDTSFYKWQERHLAREQSVPSSLADLTDTQMASIARSLGTTMAHLVNYLSPQRLVVLFDQEPLNPQFVKQLGEQVKQERMSEAVSCNVVLSALGETAVLHGGAALLRSRFFTHSEQLERQVGDALDGVA